MPRPKSLTLTDAELKIMDVLWQKGAATVGDLTEALPKEPALAYNTVLTTVRILEQKKYVRHTKEGRAFVYHPVVDREQASQSEIGRLAGRFFRNSRELLVLHILQDETINKDELQRIRHMIDGASTGEGGER